MHIHCHLPAAHICIEPGQSRIGVVHWMQAAEIWEELGDWITTNKPELGPGTKERFQMASQLQPEEVPVLQITLNAQMCVYMNSSTIGIKCLAVRCRHTCSQVAFNA